MSNKIWNDEKVKELFIDFQSGMTDHELFVKYNLNSFRVSKLLNDYGYSARKPNHDEEV